MRFTVFFSSDRLERQYCKPVQMGHGLHLVGRPWGHAKCQWMPLVLDGFGWFWASKLEVSCSGNAVWQFESPLSDCCTRKGSLRTTRSIQGKLGGHAMPWHHLVVQCRSFCLGRSTKARVSPCVTLRNSSVLFGVNMCERRPL